MNRKVEIFCKVIAIRGFLFKLTFLYSLILSKKLKLSLKLLNGMGSNPYNLIKKLFFRVVRAFFASKAKLLRDQTTLNLIEPPKTIFFFASHQQINLI